MATSPTASTALPTPPRPRLDYLDGVRALAALWVVLGHAYLFALGWRAIPTLFGRPAQVLLYLHLAVDVFIVLSGFCLALPVVRNKDRLRETFGVFLWKRCRRILPPYYAILVLILVANYFVPLSAWGRHPAGLTATLPPPVFLSNFLLLQDVLPQYNILCGPFWSISVEWHIYFFFPLVVVLLRRLGVAAVTVGGSLAAVGLTLLSHRYALTSPWYIALFCLGVASAWFTFGGSRTVAQARRTMQTAAVTSAILLLALCVLLLRYRIIDASSLPRYESHLYLIDPVTGALTAALLCLVAGLTHKHPVRRVLEWKPLVLLGTFSYSLYLTHIPLESVMHHYLEASGFAASHPKATFLLMATVGTALCIAFAYGFSLLCEKPFLRPVVPPARTADAPP